MDKSPSGAKQLIKHSTIYAFGTLSRQLVGFLLLPLYTHYLSPADYGMVGLLVFSLSLLEPLLGARLGEAIPRFYFDQHDSKGRGAVISTALTVTGFISAIAALLIFTARDQGSEVLFGTDIYGLAVGLFGVQLLTQAIEYYGLTFIRIQQKPLLYTIINISKLVMQVALNVWLLVFLKLGALGIILSGTICGVLYAIGLTVYTLRHSGYRYDHALAKRMLRFNLPLWFAGLAALYVASSNRYYIRIFSSLDEVGLYELAARLALVLPLLIWSPFSQFWEMERFKYYKNENPGPIFGSVFKFISTILVIAALGIGIFADPVIRIMSAESFWPAASAVPFLACAMIFSSLINFCGFSFLITDQTNKINQNSYATVVISTALNLALIPLLGEIGAAIALLLSLGCQFLLIHNRGKQHFDMQIRLKPLFAMLAVAAAGFVVTALCASNQPPLASIGIRTLIYVACVAALCTMLWSDLIAREYIKKILNTLGAKKTDAATL